MFENQDHQFNEKETIIKVIYFILPFFISEVSFNPANRTLIHLQIKITLLLAYSQRNRMTQVILQCMNISEYPSVLLSKWLTNNNKRHMFHTFQIVQMLFQITRQQMDSPVRNSGCLTQNNCIWPMNYLLNEVKESLDNQIGKVSLKQDRLDELGSYVCKICLQSSKTMAERKFTHFYYDENLDWIIKKAKQRYIQFFGQADPIFKKKVVRHFKYSKLLIYQSGGVKLQFSHSLNRNDNTVVIVIDDLQMLSQPFLAKQNIQHTTSKCSPKAIAQSNFSQTTSTVQNNFKFQNNSKQLQAYDYAARVQWNESFNEIEVYIFDTNDSITTYLLPIPESVLTEYKYPLRLLKLKHQILIYCQLFILLFKFKQKYDAVHSQRFRQNQLDLVYKSSETNPAKEDLLLLRDPKNHESIYSITKAHEKVKKIISKLQISEDKANGIKGVWKDQYQIDIKQQILTYVQQQTDLYLFCLASQTNKIKVLRMQITKEKVHFQEIIQFSIWIDGSSIHLLPFRQKPFVYILVDMKTKMLPIRLNINDKTVKAMKISQMSGQIKEIYEGKFAKQKSSCFPACNAIKRQTSLTFLKNQQVFKKISVQDGKWNSWKIYKSHVFN